MSALNPNHEAKPVLDAAYAAAVPLRRVGALAQFIPASHVLWNTVDLNTAYPGGARLAGSDVTSQIVYDVGQLDAGTYAFQLNYESAGDQPIVTVEIDNGAGGWTALTTIDTYSASLVRPAASTAGRRIGLTIAAATRNRQIRLSTPTKNASASAYNARIYGWELARTGA